MWTDRLLAGRLHLDSVGAGSSVVAGSLTIGVADNSIGFMRTKVPLLAPIFRSENQARLLAELELMGSELSIRDLSSTISVPYATVHNEVDKLVDSGILRSRTVGRTRLVSANPDSPLTRPLREILAIATGPVVLLREALKDMKGIESAFLYGSFAARMTGVEGPAPNDIDLMVIGAPAPQDIYDACAEVSDVVRRPVNPTILTAQEFSHDSGFLDTVRSRPAIAVFGSLPWE